MRLIDADELKKCAIPCQIHNGALTDLCVPLYQIDNAPTVEYPFYQEAYQTGYEEGKNERPQGDLISREALIEDFKSRLADCNDWIENAKDKETKIRASAVKTFICEVIMTIDNAPTVFDEKAYSDGYTQGTCDCEHAHERPQGEWLKSDIPESVLAKCSICGFDCGSYTYNFCPNCGADMRGDKND